MKNKIIKSEDMKRAQIFTGLITLFSLAIVILVYTYVNINNNTATPARSQVSKSAQAQDGISERIKDMLFIVEHLFSAQEMREILSSNIFLLLNQNKIDDLTMKFDNNTLTPEEKAYIRQFYEDIARFGSRLYPEAGQILKHYISGDGSDLEIYSNYFFSAQVIRNILENDMSDITEPIFVKAEDDPRIAYALNGFYIRQNNGRKEIYQYINYTDGNAEYIYFEFRGIKARLPNRLISVFEEKNGAKSFTVYISPEN